MFELDVPLIFKQPARLVAFAYSTTDSFKEKENRVDRKPGKLHAVGDESSCQTGRWRHDHPLVGLAGQLAAEYRS
jgi:hypothetical protein